MTRFADRFDVAELQMLGLGLQYVAEGTESWRGHAKFARLKAEAEEALRTAVEAEEEDDQREPART